MLKSTLVEKLISVVKQQMSDCAERHNQKCETCNMQCEMRDVMATVEKEK